MKRYAGWGALALGALVSWASPASAQQQIDPRALWPATWQPPARSPSDAPPSPSDAPPPRSPSDAPPPYYAPNDVIGPKPWVDDLPYAPCDDCDNSWRLFGHGCGGVKAGGWVAAGFTSNGDGVRTGNGNSPIQFNNMSDGPVLNQLWLYAGKEADASQSYWDWGFRIDYLFGSDAADTQAFGDGQDAWDNNWDTSRDYGSAMPQFYAEFARDGLTVKAGHFFTIQGYETVAAPDNFFYTHAYTMYYGEPFTHTGLLASYEVGATTLHAGWVMGWDTGFSNSPGAAMFLGGLSREFGDNAEAAFTISAGDAGRDFLGLGGPLTRDNSDLYMHSFVLQLQLTDRFRYVFQHDLGILSGLDARVSTATDGVAEWYGVNQYFLYTINDCWEAGARIEWFRDDDAVRIPNSAGQLTPGNAGNYYGMTFGLNYRPHTNLVIRPELRWDWSDGTVNQPYALDTEDGFFTGGLDFILTY